MSRSSTDDRRLRNSRVFFLLFDGVCSTTMMHCHPSPSIRNMKVAHTRFDSRQQDGRIVWRRVSIFFFPTFLSFPIHSAEHSSITSDVVATSIRNMDKNSTSTQITRQLSNWSRANSFQRNIRDTLYRGSATIRASPVVVRRPRELGTRIVDPNPRVVDLARTITRFQTPSKSKAWNCFADLASPVSDTSFDTRASRPTTVKHSGKEHLRKESGRRRATLPFHALETTIWNYVNIETCSQFDSCITGARVSPNIDNNNNNNNTTVSPCEGRWWSLRNRFSR